MAGTLIGTKAYDPMDRVEHRVANVGLTSIQVVPAEQNRRSLVLINDSNSVIYIAYGRPAMMNFGIRIEKNGGVWIVPSCCQFSVCAITDGSNKRLLITEGY